jgi:hypothetical protein
MWAVDREPTLRELLEDPLTEIIMRHDGVTRAALLGILSAASAKLAAASEAAPPRRRKRPKRSATLAFRAGASARSCSRHESNVEGMWLA